MVTPNGNVYNINGGTRPGNGPNLFHSFGLFSVGGGDIANFNNTSGLPTQNILSRVTGGQPSSIFGTLQTTGFGNANLFLMNPAGIVFGPTASLNVAGSVNITSADYLRLADQTGGNPGIFYANPVLPSVLTSAPVTAFGFLSPNPAPITVQGSTLSVPPGQTLSFVGGDVTVSADPATGSPAVISAPGGHINVASVASSGEVLYPSFNFGPNVNGDSFSSLGNITLSQGTTLDVSADAAGSVVIRGGQLMIADATISADTGNTNGASPAIDINVTGGMSISDTRGVPSITARTSGSGNAGEVRISSGNLQATSSFASIDPTTDPPVMIDTRTSGEGRAGNVSITTGNLEVSETVSNVSPIFIDSGTMGPGNGGDIAITARNVQLNNTIISTGDFHARFLFETPSGSAGNLTITADSLQFNNTTVDTGAFTAFADTQQGGDITINVGDINMVTGQIVSTGIARGGAITINANRFVTDSTSIETDTLSGPGGGITVSAPVVELTNGSSLISATFGDGRAGDILVTASDHVSLLGHAAGQSSIGTFSPSGLFSNSFGFFGSLGDAGNIIVTTPRLEMTGGRINTVTATSGHGGNVSINAGSISISGEFPNNNPDILDTVFTLGPISPSGIFTKTLGGSCTGPCGDAGAISITTGSLTMGNGSQIDSGTSTNGRGGDITINATNTISMSGTLSNGQPVGVFSRTIGTDPGSGSGGDIVLQAPQVALSNQAAISASTSGPGNAGNITVKANSVNLTGGSQITSSSVIGADRTIPTGSAGRVTIQGLASPAQSVLIDGASSGIFTNTSGEGPGGSIIINGTLVTLQNGGTLSAATAGTASTATGGSITIQGGTITLVDGATVSAASTGAGNAGTVNIQTSGNFVMNGGTVSTSATQGTGGNITVSAGQQVQMNSGALISASSSGPGNAGDILVSAGDSILMNAGTISAAASQASGGNITLLAPNMIQLVNSQVTSSVQGGPQTVGGNITIDPQFLILQNSQIIAQAVQGEGGNINITAGVFLADSNSVVDASSQTGINGSVVIQSPIANLSQIVAPLQRPTLQTTAFLLERCAVRAQSGTLSSLTVRARDIAPVAPGGMLSGPLLSFGPSSAASGASQPAVRESVVPKPALLEVSGELLRRMDGRLEGRLGGCGS
jgi:filamentous hemagglutinin family protein